MTETAESPESELGYLGPSYPGPAHPYAYLSVERQAELLYRYPELATFRSSHLNSSLRGVADHFTALAWMIADQIPGDDRAIPQTRRALDLVWEAKNRAVLAQVFADYNREKKEDSHDV